MEACYVALFKTFSFVCSFVMFSVSHVYVNKSSKYILFLVDNININLIFRKLQDFIVPSLPIV